MMKNCQPKLLAALRSDEAALGELYDRYAPRVYGLMAHILPSRDAAEEILQEVFMRLWSESPSLSQEGGSVVAWLVVTAREAAVDRLRTSRKNAPSAVPQVHNANREKGSDAVARKSKAAVLAASSAKLLERNAEAMKPRPADGPRIPATWAIPPAWLPQPKEITLIDDRLALLHKVIRSIAEAATAGLGAWPSSGGSANPKLPRPWANPWQRRKGPCGPR